MNQARNSLAIFTLLSMFLIALSGDIFFTLYYLDWGPGPKTDFFVALGWLVAQPCLLSIWCALGGQKAVWRIPASVGMLAVLTLAYCAVLQNDGAPTEVILVIGGIVIAITTFTQIPLWIFRAKSKQVITLPSESESQLGTSQFGIKHLLITTTIVAVITAIAQAFFPPIDDMQGGGPWFQVTMFLMFFVVMSTLITFLILATVFSQRHRIVFLSVLIAFLMACPLGAAWIVSQYSGIFFPPQTLSLTIVVNTYGFIWGVASGITIVMAIFYAIGFRMQRYSDRQLAT